MNSPSRLRTFCMAFTSAFLCFITVWMAALLLIHPTASSMSSVAPAETSSNLYLPDESNCMTLLLCEDTPSPNLFFLLRFQPVSGNIFIFPFPNNLVLTLDHVSEPVEKIYQAHDISGVQTALFQTYGILPQNYLRLARTNVPKLIDAVGTVQLTLENPFPMVIDDIPIVLQKGLQILDGRRFFTWLTSETPSTQIKQGEFLSQMLAKVINQHLEQLFEENSQQLFSAVVNLCDTDLVFHDYDVRRQAAAFLAEISKQPAKAILPEFVRNPDATLSLSDSALENLLAAFG